MAEDGESGPGGCVGKTPVSLLQELYVRRGMVPKVMNEFSFFCLDPRSASVFRQAKYLELGYIRVMDY